MRISEQFNEMAGALAKAQGEMSNAVLNKTNPHFKSRYADLAAIRDAVTPALAKNGIAVLQVIDSNGIDGQTLTTRLVHSSGQWTESIYPLPANAKPQEFGSALTYARRYSLAAICGISADEDDDANVANDSINPLYANNGPKMIAPQPKSAKTTAAEWADNASATIRTLSSVQALDAWESANKPTLKRLTDADKERAALLSSVIADCREHLSNKTAQAAE